VPNSTLFFTSTWQLNQDQLAADVGVVAYHLALVMRDAPASILDLPQCLA